MIILPSKTKKESSKKKCKKIYYSLKIRLSVLQLYFENMFLFSSRGCQPLSTDMRIIILLLIMKKE